METRKKRSGEVVPASMSGSKRKPSEEFSQSTCSACVDGGSVHHPYCPIADFPKLCDRCKCCTTEWADCGNCDEGFSSHDCGEDTCCCLHPWDNVRCDICEGEGGFYLCGGRCDDAGVHEKKAEG